MSRSSVASFVAVAALLTGCGGSRGENNTEKALTVPAYGGYPAITVPVTAGTPAQCQAEARAFTRAAASFLAPFPSDADNYVPLARLQFIEFKAHLCDVAILRRTLSRRLTVRQRRMVVAHFVFLGATGQELVKAP